MASLGVSTAASGTSGWWLYPVASADTEFTSPHGGVAGLFTGGLLSNAFDTSWQPDPNHPLEYNFVQVNTIWSSGVDKNNYGMLTVLESDTLVDADFTATTISLPPLDVYHNVDALRVARYTGTKRYIRVRLDYVGTPMFRGNIMAFKAPSPGVITHS